MVKKLWVAPVVLALCLAGYSYATLNSNGNNGERVDAIIADISNRVLNHLILNGIESVYLGDEYDFDNIVHLIYSSGNELHSEQLEELIPGITADYQVIFLGIGNESKQTIASEPLPGNVALITQDRKAVPAMDLMKLQRGQPLHKELNSFAKRYPEYIGGLRNQPILPGEYSMYMYIFSAPTAPYQLVIRDWLLQDIVIKQDFLERLLESP